MKKLSAIFFIVILFMNSGGYRFALMLSEKHPERNLSLLLVGDNTADQQGATRMDSEHTGVPELFNEYNGGYGSAASFNLVAVQQADETGHVLFKRNLNEVDAKDMRYDMETARASQQPLSPEPATLTINPNFQVEFESTATTLSYPPLSSGVEYNPSLEERITNIEELTPHQPPEYSC